MKGLSVGTKEEFFGTKKATLIAWLNSNIFKLTIQPKLLVPYQQLLGTL